MVEAITTVGVATAVVSICCVILTRGVCLRCDDGTLRSDVHDLPILLLDHALETNLPQTPRQTDIKTIMRVWRGEGSWRGEGGAVKRLSAN